MVVCCNKLSKEHTAMNTEDDFKIAKSIVLIARTIGESLPDGMDEELKDSWEDYKDHCSKEDFILQVKDICHSWGFPFG